MPHRGETKRNIIMADNYLEKRFEEHRSKSISGERRHQRKTLKVRRVFVTGGASGIGRAIVKALRAAGHNVSFCDIDEEKGHETALKTGSTFYHVDVKDKASLAACMEQILEKWGDIDILVNNVGIGNFKPLTEATVEDFEEVINTNLRPVFITSQLLARHRKAQGSRNSYGRIINLCSTRYLMSESGTEGYAASKGGIYSLTHALAVSLSELGITVNSITPGWIECGDYEALRAEDHLQHPSRRVGKPEDIARCVRYLCDEGNDFINGENITIDGGMTKKMIYVE